MRLVKLRWLSLAAGSGLVLSGTAALAQSTATQIENELLEEVVVTATQVRASSLLNNDLTPKSRSQVDAAYIGTQPAGQTIIQSLNLLPGVNFVNSDGYGSNGGSLRMRSFDGARISLMVDGVQLNDSGNYAIYTNQMLDPEVVERATVNLGTTDVDSPTASATGGTVNLVMMRPEEAFTVGGVASVGSYNYRRVLGRIDSGKIGEWGTSSFLSVSKQTYDKYKGPGDMDKTQINARVYQDFGNDDFISLSVHGNRNRNNFYRRLSLSDVETYGYDYDYDTSCTRLSAENGTVQNESTVTCTNYYGVRINPSDTANVRMQSSFALGDSLRLTVDPSYQYVLANGGGYSLVYENDARLIGASSASGVDLNGDGDTLDRIGLYTPNTTNTNRYSVNTALLWRAGENRLVRFGYTYDYARHRQTGQYTYLDSNGNPTNVFGGLKGETIKSADGYDLRGRDRFSIAKLSQLSVSFSDRVLDDKLRYTVGVRAPNFSRELNQYCYTQNGSYYAYCTSQTPTDNGDGTVSFGTGTTKYIAPFTGHKSYDKVLPNAGVSFLPWDERTLFYVSYAEGLSAPRTDYLYNSQIQDVQPETTKSYDLGYRFMGDTVNVSSTLWMSQYDNRIVSAYDPDLGFSVDRNMGRVDLSGLDVALGVRPIESLSLYAAASYLHTEVKNDVQYSATVYVPTEGKELVDSPDWTYSLRAEYHVGSLTAGLQGKYVAERWTTDVNDESVPSYTVFDADVNYDLAGLGCDRCSLQLNVVNLFDKDYLGNIATTRFSADTSKAYSGTTYFDVGAPRTVQFSVKASF